MLAHLNGGLDGEVAGIDVCTPKTKDEVNNLGVEIHVGPCKLCRSNGLGCIS